MEDSVMEIETKKNKKWAVIILSGFDIIMGQEISFANLAMPYYSMLSGLMIYHFIIKNSRDVSNALLTLSETDYKNCLIIYVGHGVNNENDYPDISPFGNSFNLVKHNTVWNKLEKEIKFKYIFDCCNNIRANLSMKKERKKMINIGKDITNFLDLNWTKLYCRKGQKNYINNNQDGTFFNESLFVSIAESKELVNWDKIIGTMNCLLLRQLKAAEVLYNKRWKKVVGSDLDYSIISDDSFPVTDFNFPKAEINAKNPKDILGPKKDLYNVPLIMREV